MGKVCCSDLKNAMDYKEANLKLAGKKTWILYVGRAERPYKVLLNLAKLVSSKKQLKSMPKHQADELINVPIALPIKFCPFCGKNLV